MNHKVENKVNPAQFFQTFHRHLNDDDDVICDDGNHTFLCAEQLSVNKSKHFVSPTDFNCMGYCVPVTIVFQLAQPDQKTIGIAGDGAFLMTAMEILTATKYGLSPIIFVFNDGELSQISQAQEIPYNRKVYSVIAPVDISGVAKAVGAHYVYLENNGMLEGEIKNSFALTGTGKPILVNVNIDYSKRTRLTEGTVKTNLKKLIFKKRLVLSDVQS